jgi:Tol biopolymer transport system component
VRLWLVFLGLLPILLVGSGPGAGASTPALPPHNGLIAIHGDLGLYLVNPKAGSATRVPGTELAEDAAWSPDGTRLAATFWDDQAETYGVYTIKPDGSDRTLVAQEAMSPTWSPDGEWLAVVRVVYSFRGEEEGRLVLVRSDGSEEHVLVPQRGSAPVFVSTPAWSPNGKLIAFVGDRGRIELVTPDGERQDGFDAEAIGTNLSWSPDSSRLAFDSYRESTSRERHVVVVLDLATGKETVLPGEQDGAQAPEWSPEGDQIAFLSISKSATQPSTTTTHSCGGEPSLAYLWSMRPDGTKAHRLADAASDGRVSWGRADQALVARAPAPVTGQRPAPAPVAEPQPAPAAEVPPAAPEEAPGPSVTSEPAPTPVAKTTELPSVGKGRIAVRGSNGIYLVDPDNAAAQKVPGTAAMIAPAWSPDDSLLAVELVAKEGGSSIYTIRPDGTKAQLVLENASAPSWSSSGDRIYVLRNDCATACEPEDDEANVLYTVRPDGSDLQRVDAEQADVSDRELAWRTDGSPIWFFEDGSADAPGSFDTAAAAWSPDETRIAFIGALGPTGDDVSADTVIAGLWTVSAEGGAPQLLLKGASGRPSWPSAGS